MPRGGGPDRARLAAAGLVTGAAGLAVSELVTNGFAHGRPTLTLRLLREPSAVSVHIHDGKPATAMIGSTTDDAESGRGLQIVRAVSDSLTVEDIAGDGKVVHAVFDAPQEPQPRGK